MPRPKSDEQVDKALEKVATSTAASRHIGTKAKPAVDPLMAIPPSSSRQKPAIAAQPAANTVQQPGPPLSMQQETFPISSARIHCSEITCNMLFQSEAEMVKHVNDTHIMELFLSSDEEEDEVIPPAKKPAPAVVGGMTSDVVPRPAHSQHRLQREQEGQEQPVQQQRQPLSEAAGQLSVGREWYQEKCTKCPYVTFGSWDPIPVVNRLRLHYETDHSGKEKEEDIDEYSKICQQVSVPEGIDDRDQKLHAGRFLGFPVDWRAAYKLCPLIKEPICCRVDLLHLGVPTQNTLTIERCHNRGCRSLNLSHFSETNLKTLRADQKKGLDYDYEGGFTQKIPYEAISLISEAVKAAQNADLIWGHIHRYDPAMTALAKCISEKFMEGAIHKVEDVVSFWNSTALINADRAVR